MDTLTIILGLVAIAIVAVVVIIVYLIYSAKEFEH